MLTEFARDHAFTIAWFGLMATVWFGWGQEDPPASWRWRLGVGTVLGLACAGGFGFSVFRRWGEASALDGQYHWFGVLVAAEVIAAGVGCAVLWRRGRQRWMAWWVAIVVALHFVPLAVMLADPSLVGLTVVQLVGLAVVAVRRRAGTVSTSRWVGTVSTSRWVGPVMGATLLIFAIASIVVFVARYGSPWAV